MWGNQEKSVVRDVLSRYVDGDAVDLCMRYFDVIKNFEALGSAGVRVENIAKSYGDMLTGFRGNKTFERFGQQLTPVMVHGFMSWVSFLSDTPSFNEQTASDAEKATFATSRNQFKDVAINIYMLTVKDADLNRLRKELLSCKEL